MRTIALPFILACTCAIAQNPIGLYDQAPDWSATDLNGNAHTLSDYLNDGYTVILDFSVPWCEPCDDIHQSHVLQTLYDQSGPGTNADKLMIFLISSGPEMFLHGEQGFSDWVTGTPYPIINDQSIHDLYGIVAYPRVFTICPSGLVVSNQHSTDLATMTTVSESCDHMVADTPNDAALLGGSADACLDPESSVHTVLYNAGSTPLTAVDIEAVDCTTNEVMSTFTWTGNLPMYGSEDVLMPGWAAPPGEQCVRFRIATPDDDAANDLSTSVNYTSSVGTVPNNTITVELLTDDNGDEWSWDLYGSNGAYAAQVGPGAMQPYTFYSQTIDLPPGICWSFTITNWVDGEFEPASYYRILSNNTDFITEAETSHMGGGATVHTAYFRTGVATYVPDASSDGTGTTLIVDRGQAVLSGIPADAQVLLLDAMGRMVRMETPRNASLPIDLADLSSGLYTVVTSSPLARTVHAFTVAR